MVKEKFYWNAYLWMIGVLIVFVYELWRVLARTFRIKT